MKEASKRGRFFVTHVLTPRKNVEELSAHIEFALLGDSYVSSLSPFHCSLPKSRPNRLIDASRDNRAPSTKHLHDYSGRRLIALPMFW